MGTNQREGTMPKRINIVYLFIVLWAFSEIAPVQAQPIALPSGLEYEDLALGQGQPAELGDVVTVHITGWLDDNGQKGRQFVSTREAGRTISFKLGTDWVIPAWNQGAEGMAAGGIRRLWVPAALGYGSKGAGDAVPPDSDIILEMELVGIRPSDQ